MTTNANGSDVVVSTPLRTAIGTFGGTLKDTPAVDLGATVARAVLARWGLAADGVDQVVVGNVLQQAGQGMNPADKSR
jgi:acetyl-CoA C-acetyltransferase